MEIEAVQNSGDVRTSLNYLADMSEKPATYMYKEPGLPSRTWRFSEHEVTIHDGRALLGELSLGRQGFELIHAATSVSNFYDESEVRRVYYPECERMVRQATGAARVFVFDHNVRCDPMAKRGENGAREPVKAAHNDYTLKSGPQRVRDLMGEEAEALLEHRFAVINVWRPITGPVRESPLAVCDARSMVPRDFVATDLKYRDRTGEVYSVAYNPSHRWYYFPLMRSDEVLLLKCYDSDERFTRFTAHTAFADPNSPPDAPPRESIEARTLVFFGE
ncbi:MAG: CmcJ/NvfI family oxidoreductase [Candidatus Binataceae bacterium]